MIPTGSTQFSGVVIHSMILLRLRTYPSTSSNPNWALFQVARTQSSSEFTIPASHQNSLPKLDIYSHPPKKIKNSRTYPSGQSTRPKGFSITKSSPKPSKYERLISQLKICRSRASLTSGPSPLSPSRTLNKGACAWELRSF